MNRQLSGALEGDRDIVTRDFPKILPIDSKEFETTERTWRATVRQYPSSSAGDLLLLKIDFELQDSKGSTRSLDLWIKDAPDVTLVAESVGMFEAITRWLEESEGDGELLYDSGHGSLMPFQKRGLDRAFADSQL